MAQNIVSKANELAQRRSLRLEMKRVKFVKENIVDNSSLSCFEILPQHVVAIIFESLSVRDIGVFILASKQIRSLFENYLKSKSAKRRFYLYNQHSVDMPSMIRNDLMIHFQQFGILMKRATCLYQTKVRLRIVIEEIFSLLNCNHYSHREGLIEDCPCLPFFGKFLHSLTLGWDYSECGLVLKKLQDAACIPGCLHIMLNSNPGEIPHVEMKVRHFYRSVILTECHNSYDLAFYLADILRDISINQKAHMLFVLYGPCSKKTLQYYEMCEVMPPLRPSDMQNRFADLANKFNILHLHNFISRDTIFAVLRSLRELPAEWLTHNYANLLMSLDEKLLVLFLGTQALNGLMAESGTWIALMAMITNKFVRNMEWIVEVLLAVFKMLRTANERFQLMKCVQDAFYTEIAEFHDSSAFELDDEINFNIMLSASTHFNMCFFKKHIHQGLFRC